MSRPQISRISQTPIREIGGHFYLAEPCQKSKKLTIVLTEKRLFPVFSLRLFPWRALCLAVSNFGIPLSVAACLLG